jgi:isoamyl acetate esterase
MREATLSSPRAVSAELPVRPAIAACLVLVACLFLGCASSQGDDGTAYDIGMDRKTVLPRHARIVFFGDSITEAGDLPGGYVYLVRESLEAIYPDQRIDVIGAGVTGDTVPDLQARLGRDVLSQDPTHVVIFIGVNDVAKQSLPNPREEIVKETYRRGLRSLLTRIQRRGADTILCTPAVIGEDPASDNDHNKLLDEYAAISRGVAAEVGAGLCDLRTAFRQYLKTHNPKQKHQGVLTYDGVHLNEEGNRFVARQMLMAFNAPDRLVRTGRRGTED